VAVTEATVRDGGMARPCRCYQSVELVKIVAGFAEGVPPPWSLWIRILFSRVYGQGVSVKIWD
jgi:hypothetical protein